MVIRFYRVNDAFGCFSSFSPYEVTIDDKIWSTSEHYFQAQKFPEDHRYQEKIRAASTPDLAARFGRDRRHPLRRDWDSVKDDYMRFIVLQKFAQNEDICSVLLSTGDERIVEATQRDNYWSAGRDYKGRNMLGVILMEVRGELLRQGGYLGGTDVISSIPEHIGVNNPNPAYIYQQTVLRRLRLIA